MKDFNLIKAGLALQGASIMTDQADLDICEWDRREQAAEQRAMAIDGRREAFWESKDDICRVIAENIDQINMLEAYDMEKAIREFIDECFTVEAEEDLNL